VFEPTYVYQMLQVIKYDAAFKHGHQEDAEEFLSCLLNGLHEEMVAAANLVLPKEKTPEVSETSSNGPPSEAGSYDADDEQDQWEQVGPKNKSVITRSANFTKSPISEIFGGQIRSILHQSGLKESATLQPFFTLQLDIHAENIWTVKDALDLLVSKEALQGYTSTKTKQEVEASRRITLESLPPVLVLHLKCFVYDKHGGCQKLLKKVEFDTNLEINKDLLSANVRSKYSADQRSYRLAAVVNHHGARAVGGHYSADVFHPGVDGWIRCDDSIIKAVNVQSVLKYSAPRMPYLLYYRRADTC
jgi:ubiquitin carboxyl-terminal hydrolase 10